MPESKQEKKPGKKSLTERLLDLTVGRLIRDIDRYIEETLYPEFQTETIEKEFHLLCDQTLVKVRLRTEKEDFDSMRRLTWEIIEKDTAVLDPIISKELIIYGEGEISQVEVEDLLKEALKEANLSIKLIVPVTNRYVESHGRLVRLQQSIMEGGSNND